MKNKLAYIYSIALFINIVCANNQLTLDEIYDLAKHTLEFNGCDNINAELVATTVCRAERDGSISHGLFRIPGYVASLQSKKVNGKARPKIEKLTQNAIRIDGDYGFAPIAINVGIPVLVEITKKFGSTLNHRLTNLESSDKNHLPETHSRIGEIVLENCV